LIAAKDEIIIDKVAEKTNNDFQETKNSKVIS
jgi:hypothetical protein